MKVLLVHNWYGSASPSGENVVVQAESELLRANGVDVTEFYRFSDKIRSMGWIGKLIGGMATPFNPISYFQFRRHLKRERPDVVHVHNFFPLISPAVFYAASHERVPVVLTLHNYRIGCGAGLPFRAEEVCMKCLDSRSTWPLLKFKCYRNSLAASIPMAIMISLHRWLGTWLRKVDTFITFTNFQIQILDRTGLIPNKIVRIKPQFLMNPPVVTQFDLRVKRAIFIGRVDRAKGLHVLLEAWKLWGNDAPELCVVGDGPELAVLKEKFIGTKVIWLGKLSQKQTIEELGKSQLLAFPSISFEGFPMVIREALACGVPILASDIGPLSELVLPEYGRLFTSGDSADLLVQAREMMKNTAGSLLHKSISARQAFDEKYTADKNFETLMDIYRNAIQHSQHRLKFRA